MDARKLFSYICLAFGIVDSVFAVLLALLGAFMGAAIFASLGILNIGMYYLARR